MEFKGVLTKAKQKDELCITLLKCIERMKI